MDFVNIDAGGYVLLGTSEKALFKGCKSYVEEVAIGKHPEITDLTEEKLEQLRIFVNLSSRILREGKLSEIRGARVYSVLVELESIFALAPNSTKLWFNGLKKFLPKVVAEKVKHQRIRRRFRTTRNGREEKS